MVIGSRSKSRFERRSLARQRRVERRLDQVQSAKKGRHAGGARGVARAARSLSGKARLALFIGSLLLGIGVARAVTAMVVSWWNDTPAVVTAVAVQGTTRLTPAEVALSIGLSRGHAIDDFVPAQLAEDLAAHPWIRSARVAVLPTGTVILDVEERRPRAVLERPDAAGIFIDADGVAFAEVREQDYAEALRLPALSAPGRDPRLGVESDAQDLERAPAAVEAVDLTEALTLLDHLDRLALPGLAQAELPHRGLVLALPGREASRGWVLRCAGNTRTGTAVILGDGPAAAVGERLDRLERLLSAGLRELDRTKEIDLRFAGQAVLRTEGTSG